MKKENINNIFERKENSNFFLIAGPCVIEDRKITFEIAERLKSITENLNIPFIFKASFKKANRSKLTSFTGIGDENALEILKEIGTKLDIPTLTDIHIPSDASLAANYVDILQIPAFLARQTDLLISAAKTGKVVNIKKGQFMNSDSMRFAYEKIKGINDKILLTERGTMFGYNDLVVDFRNITKLKKIGVTVMDVTHSLQKQNQPTGVSGGDPEMIETIAKAAISIGTDGLFIETHPEPNNAKSDGANMLNIEHIQPLLMKLIKIHKSIQN